MADDKYKIKIEVDDSEEKRYDAEFKARLKVRTATAIEEEKRKTASLKAELERTIQTQLEAERQGNKMKIKEAIAYRKILESQLRLHEQDIRLSNAKDLSEFRSLLKEKERLQKQSDRDIRNAPRTMLRGETGSLSRLGQVNNALSGMTFGTDQYKATERLSKNLTASLKSVGVDTRNLAQKIGGELKGALDSVQGSLTNYLTGILALKTAQELWNLSLDTKKFEVLKSNFKGTEQDLESLRVASARTVSEASLLALSNQANDLGVSLDKQAILFSLAEDAADKYGGTVEENFLGLINSTEGATKVLKTLGIQKKVYEDVVNKLAEAEGKSIDNLDPEIQKRIRLEALIKVSNVTYQDAINKQQDEADMQEELSVSLGDLITKYGWATVKGLLPFIGGIEKSAGALLVASHHTKELVGFVQEAGIGWKKFTSILDDNLGVLSQTAKGLFGITGALLDYVGAVNSANTAQLTINLPQMDVKGIANQYRGMFKSISEAKEYAKSLGFNDEQIATFEQMMGFGNAKENEANNPTPTVKGTNPKGSQSEKEKKQLTFLEELRKKVIDVQNEIANLQIDLRDSNIQAYERLRIEEELVKKREELNDLIRETIAIANGERPPVGGDKPLAKGARGRQNPRSGNDPRGEMSSEEIAKLLSQAELSFKDIEGIANNIVSPFQNILQIAGLTESAFGQILQMIQTALSAGSSVFDIFSTIMGFLPGGSVVSGVLGAVGGGIAGKAGGFGSMSSGMNRGMNFNPMIVVNSEVEKTKSIKFYGNTLPEYNRRQSAKSL